MSEEVELSAAAYVQMGQDILSLDIPMGQKVVCGLVKGLSHKTGYCYASDEAMAKLLYVSKRSVENTVHRLTKIGIFENIGHKKDRKLLFVGKEKVAKKGLTPITQNEGLEGAITQNEGSITQNEGRTYIILKYNKLKGQALGQKLGQISEKEFHAITFDHFWEHFPKRVKKQESFTLFKKLTLKEIDSLLNVLPAVSAYHDKNNHYKNTFIPECPHPTTFLRNKRWEDEVYAGEKKSQKKAGQVECTPEVELCVARFRALAEGDDVELLSYDFEMMWLLGMTQDEVVNYINTYTLDALRQKILHLEAMGIVA